MHRTVDIDEFIEVMTDEFFSYDGASKLYHYIVFSEIDSGKERRFLPSSLSEEFKEYEDIEDFWLTHSKSKYPTIEAIDLVTVVIMVDSRRFIVREVGL